VNEGPEISSGQKVSNMDNENVSRHPTRNLSDPLVCGVEKSEFDQEVMVRVYQGREMVCAVAAATFRGPSRDAGKRAAKLLRLIEEAEQKAKATASRAARKGVAFQPVYKGAKASQLRSWGIPDAAAAWGDGVLDLAVRLAASRCGRVLAR